MKQLINLLLIFLLTGCGVNCIETGQGFSNSSVEVKVRVPPEGADRKNPSTYWINTGRTISASERVVLNVTNTINLCPYDTNESKEMDVSVLLTSTGKAIPIKAMQGDYLRFSLGSTDIDVKDCSKEWLDSKKIIYYSDDEFFRDKECNTPILAKDICNSGLSSYFIKNENQCQAVDNIIPRLKGTTIKIYSDNRVLNTKNSNKYSQFNADYDLWVKPGEKLAAVKIKKINDYPNWIISKYAYDARSFSTKKLSLDELKKSCSLLKGDYTNFLKSSYKDVFFPGQFTQAVIPPQLQYSNNMYKSDPYAYYNHLPNSKGFFVNDDDYVKKYDEIIKKFTDYQNSIKKTIKHDTDYQIIKNIMNNYTGYDINCNCGMICKPSDSINSPSCVRSVLKVLNDKVICPTTEEKILDDISQGNAIQNVNLSNSYDILGGFFVVISADDSLRFNKDGGSTISNTFYENTNASESIKDYSLKLNHNYKIKNPVPAQSYIKGIMSVPGNSLIGNYTVFWNRICTVESGEKLFMYIGDSSPTEFPGNSNEHFELNTQNTKTKGIYEINVDNPPKSGTIYLGVKIDPHYDDQFKEPKYLQDNYYSVRLFFSTWEPHLSNLFSKIKGALLYILYGVDGNVDDIPSAIQNAKKLNKFGAIQLIYSHHTKSSSLWGAIQALITLYIMFSVFGYLIGVIKVTKYDLVVRIVKMAVILMLFSQNSWQFFSEHFFSLFIIGVTDIIGAFNGYLDGDSSFKFLDSTMGVLLTGETWLRFISLLVAGPVGWMIFIGIIWACISFFVCIIEAMIMYLFSIVAAAFLITLAPLFFAFLLFQLTKTLFDAWIKMLVNFSLQPIILFAALAFLNQVLLTSLYKITDFSACNKCFYGIKFPSDDADEAPIDICLISFMLPVGYSNDLSINERVREGQSRHNVGFLGLPFELTSVLILIVIGNAMRAFRGLSEAMAHSISGSISGISTSVHWATQSLLSTVGLDQETQNIIHSARRMVNSNVGADLDIRRKSSDKPLHSREADNDKEKCDVDGEDTVSSNVRKNDATSGREVPVDSEDAISSDVGDASGRAIPVNGEDTVSSGVGDASGRAIPVNGEDTVFGGVGNVSGRAMPVGGEDAVSSGVGDASGRAIPVNGEDTISGGVENVSDRAMPVDCEDIVSSDIGDASGRAIPVNGEDTVSGGVGDIDGDGIYGKGEVHTLMENDDENDNENVGVNGDKSNVNVELFKEDNNNLSQLINDYEGKVEKLSRSDDASRIDKLSKDVDEVLNSDGKDDKS
ncbi:TrbL/VirB6 family protein [Candidatus Neoehrlichia procyonis]|uniref:TrbL/VirB6 plasmid conjugal transfer family protein n=1 Tax=Candidatus Neoehrlichia procyonis str. RAC413 TaxID=1359163 RepID=A0A0F3NPY5_9RICK|nr:type IV secretion system protein [Candidatus Neoehrlichia lotoris]KJV68979.1 trbL/VirB6 plasmid conjugal transfer family protein [Candidatus Neoehrlichia lotoris str. RAC413]